MIGRLIEASARNRALVLLAALALGVAGWMATQRVELDAIPDLSDPQVIVFTEWTGRSPTLVEDQVTYPLVTALLGAPGVVDVRGQTMFGMSFVYVVFEEGTDLYWARSRVLEYLDTARARLPAEVSPRIGPDASGVGWVYQYALVDRTGHHDLGALRALQDSSVRYRLASVRGVAEVATVGGFEPQYQVTVDPNRLRAYGITFTDLADAVRSANTEVGARVIELSQREYIVRGRGYLRSVTDLEDAVVRASPAGTPVLVRDVARVSMGAQIRRGAADLDGRGEVVSGIVVMRHGENALAVSRRVASRLDELRASLPPGVEVVTVYDRAGLIERAIDTLRRALTEEMLVVALVIVLFLLHLRSALLPIVSLPLAVLAAFIPMVVLHIPATIMSLGGIAIAVGATVDAEIVMVEASHKKLEGAPTDLSEEERQRLLAEAAREVTPAIFFSLLVIAASFIPIFGLTGQAGRLFRPMAYTKTFVMLAAAVLSVTVAPALRGTLLRGTIRPEARHPVSRAIRWVYEPFVHAALRNPWTTVLLGLMAVLSAVPVAQHLGTEFMPSLDEGDLLYMPTTLPNVSIEEARRGLQLQDAVLRTVPEVLSVLGKVGRADTPTDPAPLSMVETVVRLRPRGQWRTEYTPRWYTGRVPAAVARWLRRVQPEVSPMSRDALVADIDSRMHLPGWTSAYTQPIRNRVDMLATGIRTPVGVKILGPDLPGIQAVGTALEGVLHGVRGTRSVLFERAEGGLYLDVIPDRAAMARYGLRVQDVNDVVEAAIGGVTVTTTVEGRSRFTVNVRLAQDFRSSVAQLRDVPVPLPGETVAMPGGIARTVPLGDVADVQIAAGPPMIRDEGGMLVGYVYVDVDGSRDLGGYVTDARAAVATAEAHGTVRLQPGMHLRWTGQYELLAEMEARMRVLIPLALGIVLLLLYLQFRNFTEVLIVLLSVPFALVGSVWAVYLLGYNLSTAVWVGVIALVGLAAQTGVLMIVYIDHAYERALAAGKIRTVADIIEAHAEGTIQRVRPKLMTVSTMLVGLVPLLWSQGSGADVMKRVAAPMVGGLATSAFLTLEIIPVVYTAWRTEQLLWRRLETSLPRRLAVLQTLQRSIGLAVSGATAALVVGIAAPGALPWAPKLVTWAGVGCTGVAFALVAGYVVVRGLASRRLTALEGRDDDVGWMDPGGHGGSGSGAGRGVSP